MPTTAQFITALRSMLGTPFLTQGRSPGTALDCVGLVVCGLRAVGLSPQDTVAYRRIPRPGELREALDRQLAPASVPVAGTVLLMWVKRPCLAIHVAVATGGSPERPILIEATDRTGRVAEHFATAEELGRIVKLYRVAELED